MKRFGRLLKREEGLSLIELLVVVAIMGILATLTAVAVTGTTSTTKGATRLNDLVTVTNAVSAYSGEQTQGRFPTFDGCTPGSGNRGLSSLTKVCNADTGDAITATNIPLDQFQIAETQVAVDINGDGDEDDGPQNVVPIVWGQNFTGDDGTTIKTLEDDFVDVPKHAFERIGGGNWKTETGDRPEDSGDVVTPSMTACKSGTVSECPVWVLNSAGDAVALLAGTSY